VSRDVSEKRSDERRVEEWGGKGIRYRHKAEGTDLDGLFVCTDHPSFIRSGLHQKLVSHLYGLHAGMTVYLMSMYIYVQSEINESQQRASLLRGE
jgi:hypothetical protein